MDLRVQRTRRSIINAFLELRSKKPLEKITVKELSEKALINKATFYQHFSDIYELSEVLEDEVIEAIFNSIPHVNDLMENPRQGCRDLFEALTSQNSLVDILFSGSRQPHLIAKLEQKIKADIYSGHPEYEGSLETEVFLTVLIQGNASAFSMYKNQDPQRVIEILGKITECLTRECLQPPAQI